MAEFKKNNLLFNHSQPVTSLSHELTNLISMVKGWSHIHEFYGKLQRFCEIFKPLQFADEVAF